MSEWSPDTRRVLRAYLRAVALVEPLQRELARAYGVALGDLYALRLLRDLGEAPINRLGAALGLKPSSATKLVDRLEGAGLVERGGDPADRRVTALRLTPRAHEALGDRALFESSGLARRVERLTRGEQLLLAGLLERLLESGIEGVLVPDEPPAPQATWQSAVAAVAIGVPGVSAAGTAVTR
ncbi:MAG: MarR family winged helix-turn-helix transcriptional regulator [Candidatus Limnocylindrales bacterium]